MASSLSPSSLKYSLLENNALENNIIGGSGSVMRSSAMGSSSSGRYHSGGGWDEPAVDTNGILVEHERFTPRHRLFALHRRLVHHKKKGLKLSSSRANSKRAGDGGFGYLHEPLWWVTCSR